MYNVTVVAVPVTTTYFLQFQLILGQFFCVGSYLHSAHTISTSLTFVKKTGEYWIINLLKHNDFSLTVLGTSLNFFFMPLSSISKRSHRSVKRKNLHTNVKLFLLQYILI